MDINAIIDMSKDMMLGMGHHYPTVYVEFKDDPEWQYCLLADFGMMKTTSEREKALFSSGVALGRAKSDKEIAALCFVNEAWVSSNFKAPSPSQDPKRREALFVLMAGALPSTPTMWSMEIIRTEKGIDLLPAKKYDDAKTNFLTSFSIGFQSAKVSPEELDSFAVKIMPGVSRQVRRAMLREFEKLKNRATLMDLDEFKAYQGSQ